MAGERHPHARVRLPGAHARARGSGHACPCCRPRSRRCSSTNRMQRRAGTPHCCCCGCFRRCVTPVWALRSHSHDIRCAPTEAANEAGSSLGALPAWIAGRRLESGSTGPKGTGPCPVPPLCNCAWSRASAPRSAPPPPQQLCITLPEARATAKPYGVRAAAHGLQQGSCPTPGSAPMSACSRCCAAPPHIPREAHAPPHRYSCVTPGEASSCTPTPPRRPGRHPALLPPAHIALRACSVALLLTLLRQQPPSQNLPQARRSTYHV